MKIISINTSLPKKISFNKKIISTSIFKEPKNCELKVSKNGIEGDRQADLSVHGGLNKAVYAYSYQHYAHWSNLLKKDFSKNYGLIGENLTIDNFDERKIFIGDEFRISKVVLKITQPRIPCYKITIKMNEKNFMKYFIEYNFLGTYMKVLNDGKIKKGDEIELINRESQTMSVFDISKLIFSENNVEAMKKAIAMPFLTDEIKQRFNERLVKLGHYDTI
tara:strand:+ start:1597 stop:2256 length:660 start_codon:yes stop_codon:yes gene_type:complete